MGAREELLGAAGRLTNSGRVPFSPAELIAEVRSHGSDYPETTLRTFIVGPMCENSPDNHAVQYGDLRRVGRGLYRLVEETIRPDVDNSPVLVLDDEVDDLLPDESAPTGTADWFSESRVQSLVVRHLASDGWEIKRVADTASRERGVDIEAVREGSRLVVEVKGYPGLTYARGERAGQAKRTAPPLQARAYFSNALLSGLLMRNVDSSSRVALAFPAMETYRTLATRTTAPLALAGIEVWLVAEDGHVSHVTDT